MKFFLKYTCFCLLLFCGMSSKAQFATEVQKHTLLQLNLLQEGILLVELPAYPEAPASGLIDVSTQNTASADAYAWMEAFDAHYAFSKVYFYTQQQLKEHAGDLYHTALFDVNMESKQLSMADRNLTFVFCPEKSVYERLPEKEKIVTKRKGTKRYPESVSDQKTNLDKYMGSGGSSGETWIVSKLEPTVRKINAKLQYAYAIQHKTTVPTDFSGAQNQIRGAADLDEKLRNILEELKRSRVNIKDLK